jgi:hypothetical protein
MRNGQNKRMRGRNRNHKGHHSGGGGGHHHNPLTRVYESNGPEVKIRGTAHHIAEKYLQLARDAQSSGDPVTAENFFQHAEHYFRLIAAAQEQFRQQNPYYQAPPAPGANPAEDAMEGDDGDDGQPNQGQPMQGQPMQGQPMQGQPNYGQQNFNQQPNFSQPPYPPREQPQPYGGGQPQYQQRPQQFQPQPQYQPQQQQPAADAGDSPGLPSFITGTPPQQSAPNFGSNGHDNQGGEDRFPRHRRRRHRGGGPRPDGGNMQSDSRGDDGPDVGNS